MLLTHYQTGVLRNHEQRLGMVSDVKRSSGS